MRMDVLTLFPEMFEPFFSASILGKARDKGIVSLRAIDFRPYATNKHHTVDDAPFGGGGGMVLRAEPIFAAVEALAAADHSKTRIILMCPQGEVFTQRKASELANEAHLIMICGHYEGVDERIRAHLATDEISIGDYVLTGGELAAMVVIDSVARLLPDVLGNDQSAEQDSFSTGLLEYPHYTRPAKFREWEVPDVLISGHHANVAHWRRKQSLFRTWQRRPELLQHVQLSKEERQWIEDWKREREQRE